MKKAVFLLILLLLVTTVFPANKNDNFSRAIAYYLIGDLDLAKRNLDAFFTYRPQPTLKFGFVLLFQNEKWEAAKKFRDYLESNHRSLEALTGISLATADMKNSLALDNLNKILRMNPGFAPAYLCLGNEYFLRDNFPDAAENFNRSLKYAAIPEFKILLAELFLKTAQPQQALDLMRPEVEAAPGNYYFAFMAARACLLLDDCPEADAFIDRALNLKPDAQSAQLLKGQYLLKTGELRKAKALLAKLKFTVYNPEYSLTYAEVLQKLNDRGAEKYLYEVFSQSQWDAGVNKLLGLFNVKKKNANVQNWINRAILGGQDSQQLQREFPAAFNFPTYHFSPIFSVKKIQWLANRRILVAGIVNSGEKEKLLVLDADSLKTIKSFEYEGTIQQFFPSRRLDKVIFSTSAVENEKVYLYTLIPRSNSYILKPVIGYALKMPTVLAAFNDRGTEAYFTDGSLAELAFLSPFSTVAAYGRKVSVYPKYPFPVYSYTYSNDRWAEIRNREYLRRVPLPLLQKYLMVADACQNNPEIAKLVNKGENINITASEEMKIHFGSAPDHFLIHFSDLKNAFQAWAYDSTRNKVTSFNETMFLGEKNYAELDIHDFHPEKNEILVGSRDKEKNLILFNYRTLLYKKLGSGVLAARMTPDRDAIYMLIERTKHFYYSESRLEIIRLSPYDRSKINSRRDLNGILSCSSMNGSYFTTYNGEMLKFNEAGEFSNLQVSLAGAIHQVSPDKRQVAAFINGRFYVLNWFD